MNDNSMILLRDSFEEGYAASSTPICRQSACTISEANIKIKRPNGSVQREIIGLFFESMLENIVLSWEVIELNENEGAGTEGKTLSEMTITSKKKKSAVKQSKQRKSTSKIELFNETQTDLLQHCWWTSPDERVIIHFRNGNMYEGEISKKCMHGEGRLQWADGTIYLGQFKNNQIYGKGIIEFKDDTWYEGDFVDNLRHGKGLYVDSRNQCSYAGYWDRGTKHGAGVMYYAKTFQNFYDGEWCNNIRHGFGSREYCSMSGYKGDWNNYVREGKGLMIWPNHDVYKGEWKNNVMSGYGTYIWNAYNSNSMSLPSLSIYRGNWDCGQREGYGLVDFGFGLGSYYKGEFKNNKKHGAGRLVTNNGLVLQNTPLFINDSIGAFTASNEDNVFLSTDTKELDQEPYMCNKLELMYHVQEAFQHIVIKHKTNEIINNYLENNNTIIENICNTNNSSVSLNDLVQFEINSLRKSLMCYESLLRNIYYQYATICNEEQINFTPVLIRLYLWQLYYDSNIHNKELTLIEIDNLLFRNPEWLIKTPHNPFEEIYFWQFLHSLISVATHLYAKKFMTYKKPNSIIASAFRFFIEEDILPGLGQKKGWLINGYGKIVPLKNLYNVYLSLGEQCTILTFLGAIYYPSHEVSHTQSKPIDYEHVIDGRNSYIFENEMYFISENQNSPHIRELIQPKLKLANFNNVPLKTVINIFSIIFPQVCKINKIVNLKIELSFFEFFEAFIACAEESVKQSEKYLNQLETKSSSHNIT